MAFTKPSLYLPLNSHDCSYNNATKNLCNADRNELKSTFNTSVPIKKPTQSSVVYSNVIHRLVYIVTVDYGEGMG